MIKQKAGLFGGFAVIGGESQHCGGVGFEPAAGGPMADIRAGSAWIGIRHQPRRERGRLRRAIAEPPAHDLLHEPVQADGGRAIVQRLAGDERDLRERGHGLALLDFAHRVCGDDTERDAVRREEGGDGQQALGSGAVALAFSMASVKVAAMERG